MNYEVLLTEVLTLTLDQQPNGQINQRVENCIRQVRKPADYYANILTIVDIEAYRNWAVTQLRGEAINVKDITEKLLKLDPMPSIREEVLI